jgi:membrane peptidoglycan carboxypeptidase
LRKWSFAGKKKKKPFSWKKFLLFSFLFIFFVGGSGVFGLLYIILKDLPDITDERSFIFSESTVLLDHTGIHQLYAVHGDQNRKIVPIGEISQNMIFAILAAEDDEFYLHSGFDLGGITKAFCHEIFGNAFGFCPRRGGSTITQQLVKNFFLTPERTFTRKLREIVLAYKIEKQYSKDKILEFYLNGISFGSNLGGVETASQAFFGTSVRDISVAQAAILASIPQATTKYSPFGENKFSRVLLSPEIIEKNNLISFEEVNTFSEESWNFGLIGKTRELANGHSGFFPGRSDSIILSRMHKLGYISDEKYKQSQQELQKMAFGEYREKLTAPHFVMWVRQQLEERFGSELVEHGGLRVITSLDIDMQHLAETKITEHQEKNAEELNAKNAALVALSPETGYVKAFVGSADYWNEDIDGKVNILLKKRLPGSSFKPIVFSAAFLTGKLSPASVLFDVETNFGNNWKPQNYDGVFHGPVSIREALGQSLNIPAIKAAIIAKPKNVYELAKKMGIDFDFDADFYGAAIALGGAEARPIDMASAFSTFVNNGNTVSPISILRVEDRYGNILFSVEEEKEEENVLDPAVSYLMADILSDPNVRGNGWNSRLQLPGRKNIVKTGTADKKIKGVPWPGDCWTIGGTKYLMTAVWVGNSDGSVMARKASGFEAAAPIWYSFMTEALEHTPLFPVEIPSGISRLQISKLSGLLPIAETNPLLITEELFASKNVPKEYDRSLVSIEIDSISQKIPTSHTPEDAKEKKLALRMHSYFPDLLHWEQPVQEWLEKNKEKFLADLGIEGDILLEVPQETDDVHTPETKLKAPKITFLSPKNGGDVASPRTTVSLDVSAKNGFQKIIFLWNERKVKSFEQLESRYVIPVPPSATGENILTARVIDSLQYSSEEKISVHVEEDNSGPLITILFPKEYEDVLGGSNVTFIVKAEDEIGAISKVEFFLNGEDIGSDLSPPYEFQWKAPNISEEYTLKMKAYDRAKNTSEESISFRVKKRKQSRSYGIHFPGEGEKLSCYETTVVSAGIDDDTRDFITFEVFSENPKGKRESIGVFTDVSQMGFFEASFSPDECGEWKFYVTSILRTGERRVSPKISVYFTKEE